MRLGILLSLFIVFTSASPATAGPFADLLTKLASLPRSERSEALAEAASKGTPLVYGDEVTFLAESRDGRKPTLLGGFNAWGRRFAADGFSSGRMERVPGTSWFYSTATFPSNARLEYGFSYEAGEASPDPYNSNEIITFGRPNSVLEMPDWTPSPWLVEIDAHTSGGTLESFAMQKNRSEGGRKVHVYLPRGYPGDGPYPVAYFHDGSFYVEDLKIDRVLDRLVRKKAIRPLIGVFVDPIERRPEYRGQREFLEFFTRQLVPRIDERYETITDASGRAIIGGSRGALAALFVAWESEPGFAHCGMLNPAVTPSDILERVSAAPTREIDFHVVVGLYDARFMEDGERTIDVLRAKNYPVRTSIEPHGHTPHSWIQFIPEMLTGFFPG